MVPTAPDSLASHNTVHKAGFDVVYTEGKCALVKGDEVHGAVPDKGMFRLPMLGDPAKSDELVLAALSKAKRCWMRVEFDRMKSLIAGPLLEHLKSEGVWPTETAGYDSNGNAVVESRIKQLSKGVRAVLLDCTGGRGRYREAWGDAYEHVCDVINHTWARVTHPTVVRRLLCKSQGVCQSTWMAVRCVCLVLRPLLGSRKSVGKASWMCQADSLTGLGGVRRF